jgi:hypothetical protein
MLTDQLPQFEVFTLMSVSGVDNSSNPVLAAQAIDAPELVVQGLRHQLPGVVQRHQQHRRPQVLDSHLLAAKTILLGQAHRLAAPGLE